MTEPVIRVYFGHHKCASQYIKRVMVQSTQLMGWSTKVDSMPFILPMNYHLQAPFHTLLEQKRAMLATGVFDLVCLENADNEALSILAVHRTYRGFHVIRDPRDIVVSGFFSHRYSHPASADHSPWLWMHRQRLAALTDLEEGLLAEIEYCTTYLARLQAWDYRQPHILEIRYEDLVSNPVQMFKRIFNFLHIPIASLSLPSAVVIAGEFWLQQQFGRPIRKRFYLPALLLYTVLRRNAFQRQTGGRRTGAEDPTHHYRKGVAGDWQNYFNPRVKTAFKSRFHCLLAKLGYEDSDDW